VHRLDALENKTHLAKPGTIRKKCVVQGLCSKVNQQHACIDMPIGYYSLPLQVILNTAIPSGQLSAAEHGTSWLVLALGTWD
jgi:hypothetical protein